MEKITLILEPTDENLKIAANIMKKGGIVIYPTESSYAIGADYTNKKAIEKVYKIKKRPKTKKIITIVSDIEIARKYGKLNKKALELIKKFMPGPLTLIIPGKKEKEFGFRISENRTARKLAKYLGRPITATSANISKEPPIYKIEEIEKKFFGKVDAIIDAGNLPERKVSTIVKVLKTKIKIIREGAIEKQRLRIQKFN